LGERARILVVDDDESIRTVLATILEEEQYMIDTAQSGEDAIRKTKTQLYHLALIDIRLPDMEGTELLTRMKQTIPKMRKIVITGYPSLQNAIEAVNRGADAYVMKPFDMAKVLKTIEEQLEKREQEKKFSQDKVAEFIETRVKEIETEKNYNQH
jgi:DNA-binding NtrC family response regulator